MWKLTLSPLYSCFRVTWGPAMDRHLTPQTLQLMADPYPRLSPTESQTKVLPNVSHFILSYGCIYSRERTTPEHT